MPQSYVQEVIIIAADLASLHARSAILKGFERRPFLRKEPGLHLFSDFHLVNIATLSIFTLLDAATMGVQKLGEPGTLNQCKLVAVDILKKGENTPVLPRGRLPKAYPTSRPFLELGGNILGLECHTGVTADLAGAFVALPRLKQSKNHGTIWRNHSNPAAASTHWDIYD